MPKLYTKSSLKETLAAYRNDALSRGKKLQEYTLTFVQGNYFGHFPEGVLVVRKRPTTLHEGLLNLPGGKVPAEDYSKLSFRETQSSIRSESKDGKPTDVITREPLNLMEILELASVRKLREETGLTGSFPKLVGAIVPDINDASCGHYYIVYIFATLCPGNQAGTSMPNVVHHNTANLNDIEKSEIDYQPAMWLPIRALSEVDEHNRPLHRMVHNLRTIVALCASETHDFLIQDVYQIRIPGPRDTDKLYRVVTSSMVTMFNVSHESHDEKTEQRRAMQNSMRVRMRGDGILKSNDR